MKKQTQTLTKAQTLILEAFKVRQVTQLSDYYIKNPKELPGLTELAFGNLSHPFPEYSSWILVHIAQKKPALLSRYYHETVDALLRTNNESVRRNLLAILNCFEIREYQEGSVLNVLFEWLANPATKTAIVMYTLQKLKQYCIQFPELRAEVISTLELRPEEACSPGVKVAIRKFITGK